PGISTFAANATCPASLAEKEELRNGRTDTSKDWKWPPPGAGSKVLAIFVKLPLDHAKIPSPNGAARDAENTTLPAASTQGNWNPERNVPPPGAGSPCCATGMMAPFEYRKTALPVSVAPTKATCPTEFSEGRIAVVASTPSPPSTTN